MWLTFLVDDCQCDNITQLTKINHYLLWVPFLENVYINPQQRFYVVRNFAKMKSENVVRTLSNGFFWVFFQRLRQEIKKKGLSSPHLD
jgi:phosphoribosyl-AMP cyclohydrolase